MRILIALLFAGVVLAVTVPTPANAQYCRCECYRTPHGRVCRQVCVTPPPRYVPAPQYTPRYDPTPQYSYAGPDIDPGAIAGIGLIALICAGIAAAIVGSSSNASLNRQIEAINASTASMHAEADADARRTEAIYHDIARQEHAAFLEGRADAEREWDRNHRR